MRIARELVDSIPEVEESRVLLLATIGQLLRKPSLTQVAVRVQGSRLRREVAEKIDSVSRSVLARTDDLMQDLLREYPRLF
jgi:S-adenosylmethionine synthetase